MKDRVERKAVSAFFEVIEDLSDGPLQSWTVPYHTLDTYEKKKQKVKEWADEMLIPLSKGTAKYAKAVQSITSSPACVFHAIKYKDVNAIEANSSIFQAMNLKSVVDDLDIEQIALLWECIDEMTDESLKAFRIASPRVPSSEEIGNDISQRKKSKQGGEALLSQGAYDMIVPLYQNLNLRPISEERFKLAMKLPINSHMCETKSKEALELLTPYFSALMRGDTFPDEVWKAFTKMFALNTMESAIPINMMRGIENVASKLVNDLGDEATNISNLNVEEIGRKVMEQVSEEDMRMFQQNLNQIIPAISSVGGWKP